MAGVGARVRGFLRRNVKVVVGVAACALGVLAGLAVATVPDNQGVVHSCYKVITIPGSGISSISRKPLGKRPCGFTARRGLLSANAIPLKSFGDRPSR